MKKLINIFFSKEFFFFLLVGGVNTLNGMLFPTILATFVQPNLAFILSYIPSLAISYVLNSFVTFKDKKLSLIKLLKFYMSYVPNFIIQNVVFFICYNIFDVNKYVGIIAASILGIPVTFLLMKFFAFAKKSEGVEVEDNAKNELQ